MAKSKSMREALGRVELRLLVAEQLCSVVLNAQPDFGPPGGSEVGNLAFVLGDSLALLRREFEALLGEVPA